MRGKVIVPLAFAMVWCQSGCIQPKTPAGAEAAYTAEQLRCVDESSSFEAQEACRENVRLRWGRKKDGTKR